MSPLPDLISNAKGGCVHSRGRLLTQYRSYLKTLARAQMHSLLNSKADASDLVQEVCLDAHRAFDSFRGATSGEFSAWLRAILASRLAKTHRFHGAQKRNAALEWNAQLDRSSIAMAEAFIHPDPSPSEEASNRERELLIANAIENLSADYRSVILLRHVRGLPYSEVARQMERSVDSVKKLWVRALAQLKRSVEEKI